MVMRIMCTLMVTSTTTTMYMGIPAGGILTLRTILMVATTALRLMWIMLEASATVLRMYIGMSAGEALRSVLVITMHTTFTRVVAFTSATTDMYCGIPANFSPDVVYVNGACQIDTIGYAGGGRDAGRNSCGHFALRGPMTSTVHTVCTIMATSTTTVWIGIPTGSPLNSNEKVACYVTTLGVINGYYGVFWDSCG